MQAISIRDQYLKRVNSCKFVVITSCLSYHRLKSRTAVVLLYKSNTNQITADD